jgi:hypothetical protein
MQGGDLHCVQMMDEFDMPLAHFPYESVGRYQSWGTIALMFWVCLYSVPLTGPLDGRHGGPVYPLLHLGGLHSLICCFDW